MINCVDETPGYIDNQTLFVEYIKFKAIPKLKQWLKLSIVQTYKTLYQPCIIIIGQCSVFHVRTSE